MCYWKKHVSIIFEDLSAQQPAENTFVSMSNIWLWKHNFSCQDTISPYYVLKSMDSGLNWDLKFQKM